MSKHAKLEVGDRVCHQVSRHSCEILEVLPWHVYTLLDLVTGEIFQTRARTDFIRPRMQPVEEILVL